MGEMIAPEKLLDLAEGFEIWRVSPQAVREQEKNARVQAHTTFTGLTRNIKTRGALESLPFVHRDGDTFWLISGHHRVRAAIAAELPSIIVLADPRPMTRSELVAKQIAHNALQGRDDPGMLLQLVSEIQDVGAMLEASINVDDLRKLTQVNAQVPDIKADFDWKTLVFAFLPTQLKDLEALCDEVKGQDVIGVVDRAVFEQFVTTMRKLGRKEDIRSIGALVYRMMKITEDFLAHAESASEA